MNELEICIPLFTYLNNTKYNQQNCFLMFILLLEKMYVEKYKVTVSNLKWIHKMNLLNKSISKRLKYIIRKNCYILLYFIISIFNYICMLYTF